MVRKLFAMRRLRQFGKADEGRVVVPTSSALAPVAAENNTAGNKFANGNTGTTVPINNPSASDPFVNDIEYVEVIAAQAQPIFFMRVGGFTSVTARDRAVASSAGKLGLL